MANYLLQWDKTGEKYFETGTKNAVIYPALGSIEEFSASKSYSAGDYVTYEGTVYRAKAELF